MIAIDQYRGMRVGVLGLGRSGLSAARALKAGGAEPVCWDDTEQRRAAALVEGFEVLDLNERENWQGIVKLIVSPGIPHLYPEPNNCVAQALALGVAIDNDCGLFFEYMISANVGVMQEGEFDPAMLPQVICITGSNGKSTTTALVHHVLKQAGRTTQMGGNIGRGVLDLNPPQLGEIIVLELSSYQCELAYCLSHDVSIFLNLSPDHLERHGGIGGYFAAKKRMIELGTPSVAIIGTDEIEGQQLACSLDQVNTEDTESEFPGRVVRIISQGEYAGGSGHTVIHGGGVFGVYGDGEQVDAVDLSEAVHLRGDHNGQNASAAYAACRAVGLSSDEIAQGFNSFTGLPHRMELLGSTGNLFFVNDSKATNAEAVAKALGSFENIYWIAGGQAKQGGITSLAPYFERMKKAYLIGDAADVFAKTLDGHVTLENCGTLEVATKRAILDAQADGGGVVLLSPAAASWDQFDSFEHRGDVFRELVTTFAGELA